MLRAVHGLKPRQTHLLHVCTLRGRPPMVVHWYEPPARTAALDLTSPGPPGRPELRQRGADGRHRARRLAHTYRRTNGPSRATSPPRCVIIPTIHLTDPAILHSPPLPSTSLLPLLFFFFYILSRLYKSSRLPRSFVSSVFDAFLLVFLVLLIWNAVSLVSVRIV